jgi:hypothetical protein
MHWLTAQILYIGTLPIHLTREDQSSAPQTALCLHVQEDNNLNLIILNAQM